MCSNIKPVAPQSLTCHWRKLCLYFHSCDLMQLLQQGSESELSLSLWNCGLDSIVCRNIYSIDENVGIHSIDLAEVLVIVGTIFHLLQAMMHTNSLLYSSVSLYTFSMLSCGKIWTRVGMLLDECCWGWCDVCFFSMLVW